MPDEEPELGDPYNIAQALNDPVFQADLKRWYQNPEVFENPNAEQIYRTGLRQNTLHYSNRSPDEADVIYAQINGYTLPFALREAMFWMYVRSPKLADVMQEYGVNTFDGLRKAIQNDPAFPQTDQMIGSFFIRNFPKLLLSMFELLAAISVSISIANSFDDQSQKDKALRGVVKGRLHLLEDQLKEMIGTRRRGGSKGRLEISMRRSLHVQYDVVLKLGKVVKKHYNQVFQTFDKNRKTYERKTWREFWLSHASEVYEYDPTFLSLFSEPGDPSASDVAYHWLSIQTGHAISYVKRLVIQSRKEKK